MNRFEKAVYGCMDATAALYERTDDPLHKAMLLNFWRHVHLEGSAQFDKIVAEFNTAVQEFSQRYQQGRHGTYAAGRRHMSSMPRA